MNENNTLNTPNELDTIFANEETLSLFQKLEIASELWDLPDSETARILNSGLKIHVVAAESLNPKIWPAYCDCDTKTIYIANDYLENHQLSKQDKIAIVLHEFGHILNPPPSLEPKPKPKPIMEVYMDGLKALSLDGRIQPAKDDELFSDEYVRYCGFATHLISALETLREIRPDTFDTRSTKDRLEYLRKSAPCRLNLQFDS